MVLWLLNACGSFSILGMKIFNPHFKAAQFRDWWVRRLARSRFILLRQAQPFQVHPSLLRGFSPMMGYTDFAKEVAPREHLMVVPVGLAIPLI